jgi:hypothetical protein
MAYTALNTTDIQVGKPVKKEIFDTIRSNQECFNTDIEALKQTATIDVFDVKFGGAINEYTAAEVATFIPVFRAPVSAQMVAFKVVLLSVSTSGSLEVELEKSTDEGVSWSPLLNNPVTITGTTVGSISGTVDWVDVPSQSFAQDDLLRLKITGTQVDQGEFHVSIYAEVA